MLSARDGKKAIPRPAGKACNEIGRKMGSGPVDQLQGEFSSHARLGDDRLPPREAQHADQTLHILYYTIIIPLYHKSEYFSIFG